MKIYALDSTIMIYRGDQKFYLEYHKIAPDPDGEPQLAEGKPLSHEDLKTIAETIKKEGVNIVKGMLPEHLLAINVNARSFMWWRPAGVRQIDFAKSLAIPSGPAWCPAMLFIVAEESLYVYALKDKPGPKTKVYLPPFHNTYHDCRICMGNARTPGGETHVANQIERWEFAYWGSQFSHLIESNSPVNGNINSLWKSLVDTGVKFPLGQLKSFKNKTIQSLMKEFNL